MRVTRPRPRRYDGQWLNNRKHGDGIMVYGDGNVYDGGWAGDKRVGKGCMTYAKG